MTTRPTRTLLRALPLGLALAVGVAGCGDNNSSSSGNGLDRNDPKSVAKAYYDSFYSCGEDGAGLRWDLEVRAPDDRPRSQDISDEKQEGCRPTRVPAIQVSLGLQQNEVATVEVDNPDACNPGLARLALVRQGGGWKVDRSQSDFGEDTSVCVNHGST